MTFSDHPKKRPFLNNRFVWFFVLASIALIGILLGVHAYVEHQQLIHSTEERLMAQARVVDENIKTNLTIANLLLINIMDELNDSPGSINGFMQAQVKMIPGIRTIVITDTRGCCIYSNRDILIGRDFSDRDYFKTPRNASDKTMTFLSPPFESVLGKLIVNITRALTGKQGEFEGIVTLALEPEYFLTLLKSTLYTPDNRIALVHSDGTIFLNVPDNSKTVTGQQVMKPGAQFYRHIQGGEPISMQTGTSATTGDIRVFAFITNIQEELHVDKHLVVGASRRLDDVLGHWRFDSAIQILFFILLAASSILITRTMLLRRAELARLHSTHTSILDSAGEGIMGLDRTGKISFCNDAVERITGKSRRELVGCDCHQNLYLKGFDDSAHQVSLCPICLTLNDGRSRNVNDGMWINQETIPFPLEYTLSPLLEKNQVVGAVIVFKDVTEKREIENERIKNAEYNGAILNSIRSHLAIINKNGGIVSVNEAWRDFASKNRTEDGKLPENTDVGVNYLELCLKHDDEYSSQAIEAYQGIISVLDGSVRFFTLEYPCHSPDVKRWFIMRVEPLQTHDGGAVIIHTDITQRKQEDAEREKLETLNWQLQKAESLGRMAGAIAHLFNNQLSAVIGNLELSMLKLSPQNEGAVKNLTSAMQATHKAATVSGLMLTYLGQTTGKRESMDISEICRQYLPMLQACMQSHVSLITNLPSNGPIISANTNQIQQVLLNIVTNASESIGDSRGSIHLNVKKVSPEEILVFRLFPIDWKPQNTAYVLIEIADTGCGIANMDIENIFDPFFSTKFAGRGLGLSVVMGIVRAHGGGISVESDPDQGSLFRVFLPVSAG